MAEIHGNQGAIFYRNGYIAAKTIAFTDTDPDTITDSDSGLVTAGFLAGDTISVSGSTSNDGEYTIAAGGVAAGALTLIGGDSLTGELEGDDVIVQSIPGVQLGGFFNWTINYTSDTHDTTSFEDGTARVFTTGLTGWTGQAERFFLTGGADADIGPAVGTELGLRFFIVYAADPSVTTCYYYETTAIVTSHSPSTPVDDMVKNALTFQGTGALTFTTRTIAWG